MQRIVFAVLTGYSFFYFSEASFWTRPLSSTSLLNLVETVIAYSFAAYFFLWLISAFRVRSFAALFLAGAIYGWIVEGVISSTLYLDLPISISLTGLSWHTLFTILIGWWLLPTLLREKRTSRLLLTFVLVGLVYGFWSLSWWTNAPPPTPLVIFALYNGLTTLLLVLAYWLASRVQVAEFKPSRAEFVLISTIMLIYFAVVTVLSQPLALVVLPLLLLPAIFILRHNRKVETGPDLLVIAKQQGSVSLLHACSLFLIPLTAILVYALALASDFSFPTGNIFYIVTCILGFVFLIVACIQICRRKRPAEEVVAEIKVLY